MAKAKKPTSRTVPPESSLFMMRMKELDREFARQTKQLATLTKKFGKKITRLPTDKTPKSSS